MHNECNGDAHKQTPSAEDQKKTPQKPDAAYACLNCGHGFAAADQYCAKCGQKKTTLRVSLASLVSDFFAQQFSLDSKFFRTLKTLLFFPGRLTNEFCQGRRSDYFTPIQIYLITAVLFFLCIDLLTVFAENSPVQVNGTGFAEMGEFEGTIDVTIGFSSFEMNSDQWREFTSLKPEELKSFFQRIGQPLTPTDLFFARGVNQMAQPGGLEVFVASYIKTVSQTVLVMMPVFGLILYGLFWRRSEGLVQSIVFSAHLHAYSYVTLILLSALMAFDAGQFLMALIWCVNLVYFVLAMRNVYGGHYVAVTIKVFIAGLAYMISMFLFIALLLPLVLFTTW